MQLIPGGDVCLVIVGVTVGESVCDRDRPVGRDGQDPQQLLEIGAVVLAVAVCGRRGGLAGALMSVGCAVGAVQRDRRRVVVQLEGVSSSV